MRFAPIQTRLPFSLSCIVAATLAFGLSACGGGASSTPASAPAPGQSAPPAPSGAANVAPVGSAGEAQSVKTGATVTLDASGSTDADGDALSYAWTMASAPAGSAASLSSTTAQKPTFVADVAGSYVFSLVVSDGRLSSAAASVTVSVAPTTWKDADCTQSGSQLPACSQDFSDNNARTAMGTDGGAKVILLTTDASGALAATPSAHNGVKGNKAVYGLDLLHKVKLSEFPGIGFEMKLDPGATAGDTTILDDTYVTYTISLKCDGDPAGWRNLITMPVNMNRTGPDADGYATYSAAPGDANWNRSGSKALTDDVPTVVLNGALGTSVSPLPLTRLVASYPDACIYNWPNASGGITPAVVVNLSDSNNLKPKSAALKNIVLGEKKVF